MSARERLAEDMQQAVNELQFLRCAASFDPEQVDKALKRAADLLGSAVLIVGCPEAFDA
jgi:coenzyme F420-reducing hydrogenase delta subunit